MGTYVDVGGGHPVADNVSFWFYLKGWRGLIVEPQQALADIYAHVRPRDHAVCCLAGRAEGEAEFHVVDKLHGFSTTVREHAAGAQASSARASRPCVMPVRTLSALIEEAGLDPHRLPQDRRGGRGGRGAGRHGLRALPPARGAGRGRGARQHGRRHGTHGSRELSANGYRFAFFDRLNRFYVAEEEAELAQRFPAEPAPWDKVGHLWDCGRAPERPDHPDHKLAQAVLQGFFATLPSLDPALLRRIIETGCDGVRPHVGALPKGVGGNLGSDPISPLLGTAEFPRSAREPAAALAALLATDQFRAALGRIACMYDGGHLLE